MDKNEIIERLGEIAKHAVHIIGEEPFIMSLDDGTAVYEAIDIIQQSQPQRIGHWVNGRRCSICGDFWDDYISGDIWYDGDPQFCPHCGAKMDGEGLR